MPNRSQKGQVAQSEEKVAAKKERRLRKPSGQEGEAAKRQFRLTLAVAYCVARAGRLACEDLVGRTKRAAESFPSPNRKSRSFSMRRRRIVLGSIGVIGAFIVTAVAWGRAPETKKPVESFLPMGSVLYIGWDGTEHHKEAWEKTVAYEAIEKSGLVTTLTKIVLSYVPVEHKSDGEAIQSLLKSLAQNGVSLSVSFTKGTDVPTVVLVLQDPPGLSR